MIKFRRAISYIFSATLISALLANGAQAAEPIRNYQIDVVPIANAGVTMDVTEELSRQIIAKINHAFDDATGGQVQFSFRKLHDINYSKTRVVHSSDVPIVTGLTPTPDPGYETAFLVGVIAYSSASEFSGEAYGNYVLMNGTWNLEGAWVLTHELGHNLGLLHANSAVCSTQIPITCDQLEYGDYSSTMGRSVSSFFTTPMISRFSATELDKLKLLPKESRAIATETGDYKLAPVYSKDINLPKVLYIPIGSELTYSVEYRPAVGNDSTLSESQVFIPGSNSYYPNIPSYGLQLRILKTTGTQFKDLQPNLTNLERFETALVVPSFTADQVNPIGKVFTLSDGTTVTFLDVNPSTGASVRVERSIDKDAPVALELKPYWAAGEIFFNTKSERIIYKKDAENWVYPVIEIPLDAVTDNRLVKNVQVEVNNEIIGQVDTPALNNMKNYSYQTTKAGKFTIKLIATDFAGLSTTTEPTSLVTTYNHIATPFVTVYPGKDATNSALVVVVPITNSTTYVLEKLSSGIITSTAEKKWSNRIYNF